MTNSNICGTRSVYLRGNVQPASMS